MHHPDTSAVRKGRPTIQKQRAKRAFRTNTDGPLGFLMLDCMLLSSIQHLLQSRAVRMHGQGNPVWRICKQHSLNLVFHRSKNLNGGFWIKKGALEHPPAQVSGMDLGDRGEGREVSQKVQHVLKLRFRKGLEGQKGRVFHGRMSFRVFLNRSMARQTSPMLWVYMRRSR